jgi:hypothetical protein
MSEGIKGFCKRAYERRSNEDIKAANGIFDAPKAPEAKQTPITATQSFAAPVLVGA